MLAYLVRRLFLAVLTVWAVSVLSFVVIQLPPGDYITSYIAQMSASGSFVSAQEAEALRQQYGLDKPVWVQYLRWMKLVLQGKFGMALEWGRPVSEVIGDRLWLTMAVSIAAIILTWALALPIGIYSAVRQYSIGDYIATFIGFAGLAVPSFMLALVLMYFGFTLFNMNIGGLFSDEFAQAQWSLAKAWDLVKHLPLPGSPPSTSSPTIPSRARSAICSPTWSRAASLSRSCFRCPQWDRSCSAPSSPRTCSSPAPSCSCWA